MIFDVLWFGSLNVGSHDCYAFMVMLRQGSMNIYIVCLNNGSYDIHFTCVLFFPRYIYIIAYNFSLTINKPLPIIP